MRLRVTWCLIWMQAVCIYGTLAVLGGLRANVSYAFQSKRLDQDFWAARCKKDSSHKLSHQTIWLRNIVGLISKPHTDHFELTWAKLKVSYWDHVMSVVRCAASTFFLRASPPTLLEGFQPNYTEMILRWSPLKFVQMVLVCWLIGSQELKID